VTDSALILLTAAILSAVTTGFYASQIRRLDADGPERLIGELRLSQWMALLLAVMGSIPVGLAIAANAGPLGNVDISEGIVFVVLAGMVLQSEPRTALALAIAGFIAHALTDIAHRPGWLSTAVLPQWYAAGCGAFDVVIAALCYWARRR